MKPGYIIEECRLCGQVFQTGLHVPDIFHAFSFIFHGIKPPWGGFMLSKNGVHECEDGRIGVTDVVGGTPD